MGVKATIHGSQGHHLCMSHCNTPGGRYEKLVVELYGHSLYFVIQFRRQVVTVLESQNITQKQNPKKLQKVVIRVPLLY